MKKKIKINRQTIVFATIAAIVFMFAANSLTLAQADFKVGQTEAPDLTPKMTGAFPSLPGTAWKIDFGRGVTGTVFQFCKNRTWEIIPQRVGTIGAVGKSYSVSGSTLTTINADDGMVGKWKMSWKGGVLELFDGKASLRLHYDGENHC
jgi:hypothetical protein